MYRASDSCLMLDYVRTINFLLLTNKPHFSKIEQSVAELLRFKYVQFWRRSPS